MFFFFQSTGHTVQFIIGAREEAHPLWRRMGGPSGPHSSGPRAPRCSDIHHLGPRCPDAQPASPARTPSGALPGNGMGQVSLGLCLHFPLPSAPPFSPREPPQLQRDSFSPFSQRHCICPTGPLFPEAGTFGLYQRHVEVLGPGIKPMHSSDLSHSSNNAGSLTPNP